MMLFRSQNENYEAIIVFSIIFHALCGQYNTRSRPTSTKSPLNYGVYGVREQMLRRSTVADAY